MNRTSGRISESIIIVVAYAMYLNTLVGCANWYQKTADDLAEGIKPTTTQAAGGYVVLDWIFVISMVGAAALLFLSIIAPARAKPWAIAGAVATGVSAIALKVLLVKYLPWIIGGSLVAGLLAGLVFGYANRWWIERKLSRDLDSDGHIGEPPAPTGAST